MWTSSPFICGEACQQPVAIYGFLTGSAQFPPTVMPVAIRISEIFFSTAENANQPTKQLCSVRPTVVGEFGFLKTPFNCLK